MYDEISKKHPFLNKVKTIDGKQKLAMQELLNEEFLKKNTEFTCINDFLKSAKKPINSQEDFEKIPKSVWDEIVNKNSNFASLQEMTNAALDQWLNRNLGLK